MTPQDFYKNAIDNCQNQIKELKKRSAWTAFARLVVFTATAVCAFSIDCAGIVTFLMVAVGLTIFLFLTKISSRISNAIDIEKAKQKWVRQNIDRMNLNLSKLPTGEQFAEPNHDFASDIDIFGKSSLFTLLNSTSTKGGEKLLADWLQHPERISNNVVERQNAIQELTEKCDFRLNFAATGEIAKSDKKAKSEEIPSFKLNLLQKIAIYALPLIFLTMCVLSALDMVSGNAVFWTFFIILGLASLQAKRVGFLHEQISAIGADIARSSEIFKTIENAEFNSAILKDLQRQIHTEQGKASVFSKQLSRYINNLDQRYNVFGYIIMNGLFIWDWRQLNNIDKWLSKHQDHIEEWKSAIANYDALCALASFSFNFPQFNYPTYEADSEYIVEAVNAGHPMIQADRCVRNDIKLLKEKSFFIITGANMAGKSTYLRTVAVNYLLAEIGAPVFADSMKFTPTHLYTGLRVADSLNDGASYFFAELKRLETMVKRAESGEKMLVILDEILRGTNSIDKQKGSLGLIKKLIHLPVGGIIATHDLAVGTLADAFPDKVQNFRFEAETNDDELTFSYHLQPGVAQNTNAFFLMKKMGIID